MLSKLLSYLFLAAFGLVVISGSLKTIADIKNSRLLVKNDKNSYIILGEPGMMVQGSRINTQERNAPDSLISYKITDSSGRHLSGTVPLGQLFSDVLVEQMNKNIKAAEGKGQVLADTQFTFIGEMPWGQQGNRVTTFDQHSRYGMFEEYIGKHKIEGTLQVTEQLRILPVNKKQIAGFVAMDIIIFGCIALLFFSLGKLFQHFGRQDYFSRTNVKLLRNIGLLLLIPQFARFLCYWLFLVDIHPLKLQIKGEEYNMLAQYDIKSGLDWTYIFLGLGLVILSYIFKQALVIKEDSASII